MTSDPPPTPPDEDHLGTPFRRLLKPIVMALPLMIVVLVPAFLYGRHSLGVATEADAALISSLTTVADGPGLALPPSSLCDTSAQDSLTTSFTELDLDGENHKASVSGPGFNTVVIDLKGWVDDPPERSEPSTDSAIIDERDDISIRLERSNDDWCVADVITVVSESEDTD